MKTPPSGLVGFDNFWEAWPPNKGNYGRKVNRPQCLKVWKAKDLEPDADEVIYALECWKKCKAWQDEEGKFIPMVETWLNQERYLNAPRVGAEEEKRIRLRLRFNAVYATVEERDAVFAEWVGDRQGVPLAWKVSTAFMEWALIPKAPEEWRLRA